MAKSSKNTSKSAGSKPASSNGKKSAAPVKVAARSDVRNSPVPKAARRSNGAKATAAAAPKVVTDQLIAVRAYEIWASGQGGSEFDNWVRAERELRGL